MRLSLLAGSLLALTACRSTHDALSPTDTARKHRSFEFTYEASIEAPPAGAKDVRLWIPIPIDTPDQRIEDVRIEANGRTVENAIENGFGKSVCVMSSGEPVKVKASYRVTRYETHGGPLAYADLEESLQPDAKIPLDGKVALMAASMPTAGDPRAVGKALYQHTLERMKYDKPEGQPWGRGDAEWACDSRYGNCTDFHSYFIGLARTKQIPARFEMGFSIPGGDNAVEPVKGYHCWAYFWNDADGWVPVDISEADKAQEKAEYFFGTLDEHRFTMTGGRDLLLTPRPAAGALNFFIYPYAEVDGVEFKDVKRSFSRKNL
ncbi:MAG: transglutaminase domain-containing protein [Planctomycetes bacterium]|nr:transglutaminase domain-containing protein [Planctomycetota bacterium]